MVLKGVAQGGVGSVGETETGYSHVRLGGVAALPLSHHCHSHGYVTVYYYYL